MRRGQGAGGCAAEHHGTQRTGIDRLNPEIARDFINVVWPDGPPAVTRDADADRSLLVIFCQWSQLKPQVRRYFRLKSAYQRGLYCAEPASTTVWRYCRAVLILEAAYIPHRFCALNCQRRAAWPLET